MAVNKPVGDSGQLVRRLKRSPQRRPRRNNVWLVKVWSPDDPSESRCFCALISDEASAAILVRDYGNFDDGLIVQPFAQIFDDEAQPIIEAYGLRPGGVMPWPAKGD